MNQPGSRQDAESYEWLGETEVEQTREERKPSQARSRQSLVWLARLELHPNCYRCPRAKLRKVGAFGGIGVLTIRGSLDDALDKG